MLITLILSGGGGSRLWSVSLEGHTKPLIKLLDGQCLLAKNYRPVASLTSIFSENGKPEVPTVTNRDHYFISKDELQKARSFCNA
jgi:mannose-1-phosphate guanylyltransferase